MRCLSTIVLNWNRETLLEKTLRSYLATVTGAAELIIVDNANTDGARAIIARTPCKAALLLDANLGGEAVNVALEHASGELIHITENDQLFLPGWAEHVRDCFDAFAALGQLSLHGLTPTDDEVWEVKPGNLRFACGKIVYEAHGNVGTSSILPASVFRAHGIRVHNLPAPAVAGFTLPDDRRLSADVKALGLWCAWSDRYYVRNIGHEVNEFARAPDYYHQNYAAKPWLGVEGWQGRVAAAQEQPHPQRSSIVFPHAALQPEKTMGDVSGKPAQLWSMFDGWTAELEVLDAIHTLVRLVKPACAIETGTWLGRSAVAIGTALRANGFGRLTTVEVAPEVARYARAEIQAADLLDWVEVVVGRSLDIQPPDKVEFALFDLEVGLRCAEFRHVYGSLANGAVVVFHDTGPQHAGLAEGIRALIAEGLLDGCFMPAPRGLFVGTVQRQSPVEAGELGALRARVAALETSTSWRVTRPLRAVMECLRKASMAADPLGRWR